MARGFMSGAFWGLVVAGIGAGALSVMTEIPERPTRDTAAAAPAMERTETEAPDAGAGELPAAPGDATADAAAEPAVPASPAAEAAPDEAAEPPAPTAREETADAAEPRSVPPARRPDPEQEVSLADGAAGQLARPQTPEPAAGTVQTAPVPRPEADTDAAALTAPVGAGDPARVAAASDAPVQPQAPGGAPAAPGSEAPLSISTEPAQPPAPPVPAEESGLVADAGDDGRAETDAGPANMADASPTPDAGPGDAEATAEEPAPEIAQLLPEPGDGAATPSTIARPSIGTPARTLTDRADAVETNRLPTIGGAPATEAAVPSSNAEQAAGDGPLERFAAPVTVPEGQPRISIVLIDDGTGPLGPDALEAFPFPVTFAIAASHPDATGVARGYRDLGFEVLAVAAIPDNAQPADVEIALEGTLAAVPEAVGIIEAPEGGLQGSRSVSDQVTAFAAGSGHGLVMVPNGLNAAQERALQQGVPSATLYRDFDGEGQDARTIRRTLDQAAFRARQEGAAVLLGRLRADTISALLLWGLQERAEAVALVPVSTVLRESVAE